MNKTTTTSLFIFVLNFLVLVPLATFVSAFGTSRLIFRPNLFHSYNNPILKTKNRATKRSNMGDDDGWASVPTKQTRRKQHNYRAQEQQPQQQQVVDSDSLPWVSPIPPTAENSEFKPFVLLLCGVPGSGKSTFAKSLQHGMPFKYVRINQDDLGNRKRCEELARSTLANGQCPVIDRCNFDHAQRKHFVMIAAEFGAPVDCLVLQSARLGTVEECIQRCQKRQNHPTIKARDARTVVTGMARDMKAPAATTTSAATTNQEGIRHVRYVTDRKAFNEIIGEYFNRKS